MKNWFKNNFFLVFFGIFAFVGTALGLAGAGVWLHSNSVVREGVRTEGSVVDMVYSGEGNSQAPVIEFETDAGERRIYTSNTSSSPPSYHVGEQVTLWYLPDDPDTVVLSGMDRWLLPLIFGIFFFVFGGIGYGGLIYQFLKKRDKAWLLQNGQPVEADVTNIYLNTSVKMNGSSPFGIQCQWLDKATNEMLVFESDYIWFDPTEFVQNRPVRVLIDPRNPKKYHVDLSFLPEVGN